MAEWKKDERPALPRKNVGGETPEEFRAKCDRVRRLAAAEVMADPVKRAAWEEMYGAAWRARRPPVG